MTISVAVSPKIYDFARCAETRDIESDTCEIAHMFDWQDLHCFLAVARLGSMTAAATELGVDHATVGRRIARLESMIGVKLLVRLPRSTRLTEEGTAFVRTAGTMEEGAEAAIRSLRGQSGTIAGTVTVSALPVLAAFVIAPGLPGLIRGHPAIRVVLSATSTIASLERGEADIAIGFVRPKLPGRVVRRIGDLEFGLYGLPAFADRPSESWPLIGFETSLGDILQQRWLDSLASGRSFILRSNDVATQMQATRAGVGVALLPRFLGEADSVLARLETRLDPPVRPLWMSVHADVRRSAVVRAVMDHLANILGGIGGG
ncbi:MAG TPA: LysR family transcriptional regulator [Acidiphilium sp.]